MTAKLENQVAIITGCSGGIGKQIAVRFAQEGAKIAICDIRFELLQETKLLCEKAGAEVLALHCDVSIMKDLETLVEQTVATFGKIDILVNNAVFVYPGTVFLEQSEEYLMKVFDSGFLSTWRLMKLCFPYLKKTKGRVINFGSGAGIRGVAGFSAYGAVKEAIRSLTRTVANEWGQYGITCNNIVPNTTKERKEGQPEANYLPASQKIPPVGYLGDPYEDLTPIVVFLASKDSRYLTGETFRADGGGSIFAL